MLLAATIDAFAQSAVIDVPRVSAPYRSFSTKRFSPAPMPGREGFDQESQAATARLRDPLTGSMVGQFGSAYLTSSPVPVLNPALKDPDNPGWC